MSPQFRKIFRISSDIEMFQSLKSVTKYLIISDHHACQTGQLWFPRKRDSGSEVLCSVQTLRGAVIKAGKSRNCV